MTYPTHSLFSINIVVDSIGQSRLEIVGSMKINWNSYLQKQSILDCLEFGEPTEVMDANTPDILCIDIPTA
jgi:hypothetical protein